MKKVVLLTGAGISAESGLNTFRDSNGLWNNYSIYEVATPDAWRSNPQLVLDFYNHRRNELEKAVPNQAHKALVDLEDKFDVTIVTQNVDNLHERAGSSKVLHLHGELTQVRGEFSDDEVIEQGYSSISLGDRNTKGEQLRPNIVWFGEDVPRIIDAEGVCSEADVLIIVGTSLNVYPAAGLVDVVPVECQVYLIDPKADEINSGSKVIVYKEKAGTRVPALVKMLLNENS